MPVAEIGLGDRAQAGDRAAARPALGLRLASCGWRGSGTSGRSTARVVEQPFARAARRDQARQSSTSLTCSATWMWIGPSPASAARPPQARPGVTARRLCGATPTTAPCKPATACAAAVQQPREAVEVVDEAALARRRRRAAEAAMGVEHRQQRQADAGRRRRGGDPLGHLGEVGIGPPVAVVVQVVELADAGEAGLQHLDIELGGDRLDVVGRQSVERSGTSARASVQKLSRAGPRVSASPAMPRWKAWLCRLRQAGQADRRRARRRAARRRRSRPRRCARRRRAAARLPRQPCGIRARLEAHAATWSCRRRQLARRQYV